MQFWEMGLCGFNECVSICCQIVKITSIPCLNGGALMQFHCIKTHLGFPQNCFLLLIFQEFTSSNRQVFVESQFWENSLEKISQFWENRRECIVDAYDLSPQRWTPLAVTLISERLCTSLHPTCVCQLSNASWSWEQTLLSEWVTLLSYAHTICKLEKWILLKSFQNRHLILA